MDPIFLCKPFSSRLPSAFQKGLASPSLLKEKRRDKPAIISYHKFDSPYSFIIGKRLSSGFRPAYTGPASSAQGFFVVLGAAVGLGVGLVVGLGVALGSGVTLTPSSSS